MDNHRNPTDRTAATRDVRPSTLAAIAASITAGELLYCPTERTDHRALIADLRARLALRQLSITCASPGWYLVGAHQLVQAASCTVVACLGRLAFGRCQRCGTRA